MRKRYFRNIIASIVCVGLLSGCAGIEGFSTTGEKQEDEIASLGLTPEFDYEVPKNLPDIMVNQLGYAIEGNKIAVFRGEILPDTYALIDAQTEEIVYQGQIVSKGYNETTKEEISYGDFTEYQAPGSYYLQADIIGRSYPFVIADEPYESVFNEVLKQYYYNRCGFMLSVELAGEAAHGACHTKGAGLIEDTTVELDVSGGWHMDEIGRRDVLKGCYAINSLLLAYELYGEVFTDDVGIPESGNGIPDLLDEVKYEIDWLLKMQDAVSGAVYSRVTVIDNETAAYALYVEPVTMDATIHFAAAMAKFSYLYQTYDLTFANQCLKAADRAYRYAGKYIDDVDAEDYFYAAAELYRATGSYGYRKVAQDYLTGLESLDIEKDAVFWGCVTYLSTKQKVDMELCNRLISLLLADVEQISYASKSSKYLTEGNKEQSNNSELLKKMTRMSVADHIITNHEYTTVLENHLHYFMGRNAESISYIDGVGSRNYQTVDEKMGIMKQSDLNAELILLMSAVLAE
ncbi:MAG: glycoside hydrolase family 9 protein [Blautia sp.]|nr:glycoside hydrolase family 9 protein [Lachnoclostridium sp.]MCM1211579.1 glycoside hydrolase family 9 protein [Blautia sp.]